MKYLFIKRNLSDLVTPIIILLLFTITGCAKKMTFQQSTVVPAARGYVKITKDDNKNYRIKLELSNLAEINKLDPQKESYVVWMSSDNNTTTNLGRISSSGSLLSKRLTVSFETVTATKPSLIFITAENDSNTKYPAGTTVMTTGKF
jgi:ABC-type Fe3+-hydroxamate transport system substrate-binding protein